MSPAVGWDSLLSEESRQRLEHRRREVLRLAELSPRWLAAELLRLARRARTESCRWNAFDIVYDSQFIWHGVPELARRLGAGPLAADELVGDEWAGLSDYELRRGLGHCLGNIGQGAYFEMPAWELLLNEPANGNPVVMGVDFLCPGCPGDREDPLVVRLAEIARARGVPFDGIWSLSFLNGPDAPRRSERMRA